MKNFTKNFPLPFGIVNMASKHITAKRITRSRKKGWTKPDNTIYVGRGSKWGNPFRVMGDMLYIDAGYRRKILDKWVLCQESDITDEIIGFLRILIRQKSDNPDIQHWISHFETLDLSELEGKNLMCWCKQDTPCHADILLIFAQMNLEVKKIKAKRYN